MSLQTVDVVVVTSEPKGNELPPDLVELLPPFTTPEGIALIPNLKVLFQRAADRTTCEASILLDRKDVKPSFLSGLFGTSGLPLDQINKSWIARAKKPLTIGTPAEAEVNRAAAATELEFVQNAVQHFASPNVFSYRCGDLSVIDPKAQTLKDHHEYQQAAIRCAKTDATKASRGMLILHGFDLSDPVAEPPSAESKHLSERPLPSDNRVPSQVRARLPETMRAVLDAGTARITATIHYGTNSTESPVTASIEFDRVAAETKDKRYLALFIVGFADRRGSVEDKLRLSRERALAVAREMQRRQAPVSAAIGLGDALEVDLTATPEGNALNRRVDLILVEQRE